MIKINWAIATGTDYSDECYAIPGDYSAYIIGTNNRYYAEVIRSGGKWHLKSWQNFYCYNSKHIKLLCGTYKTKKAATAALVEYLERYDAIGITDEFNAWASEVRRPVYKLVKRLNTKTWVTESRGIEFVGWNYLGLGIHDKYDFRPYAADSLPINYGNRDLYVSPQKTHPGIIVDVIEFSGCGYSSYSRHLDSNELRSLCGDSIADDMRDLNPDYWSAIQ